MCEFTLAINRPPRDGQEQNPLWVNCKAWGKTAQVAGDYVRKGSKVAVVGRLEIEQWTDRTSGEVRSKTLVVIDRMELCGSRGGGDGLGTPAPSGGSATRGHGSAPQGATAPDAAAPRAGGWGNDWTAPPAGATPISDEEVPF